MDNYKSYYCNNSLQLYIFFSTWFETSKLLKHRRIDAFELWCWRRLLRVPWTARRSNQSILKQPWDFFGRNDAKAETPVLWPPHAKSWLIGKDSDTGRDWGQEDKGTTEDEMAGWHHWLDGRGSQWTPGVGDGQGGLACCDSWSCNESDTTEQLNWTELGILCIFCIYNNAHIEQPSKHKEFVWVWVAKSWTRLSDWTDWLTDWHF